MLPLAFGFNGRTILLFGTRLILDGVGRLDGQIAEFLLVAGVFQVIAPKARLRLETNVISEKIAQIRLLAEDECREPQPRGHVRAPTVKVQVETIDA